MKYLLLLIPFLCVAQVQQRTAKQPVVNPSGLVDRDARMRQQRYDGKVPDFYFLYPNPYYKNNSPLLRPAPLLNIAANFEASYKDTLITKWNYIMGLTHGRKTNDRPSVNDTLLLNEADIELVTGYKNKPGGRVFSDTIALNRTTRDTLKGFYKVMATPGKSYDYYIGWFTKGSPYQYGFSNCFEYYKNGKLAKRRFYPHNLERWKEPVYAGDLAEDYMPITQKTWRREIVLWPEGKIIAADTIKYNGSKGMVHGIQRIYASNRAINDYWLAQMKHNSQNPGTIVYKEHLYKNGHPQHTTLFCYPDLYEEVTAQLMRGIERNYYNGTTVISQKRGKLQVTVTLYDPDTGRLIFSKSFEKAKEGMPNTEKFSLGPPYGKEDEEEYYIPTGTHYTYSQWLNRDEYYGEWKTYEDGAVIKVVTKTTTPYETLADKCSVAHYGEDAPFYYSTETDFKNDTETQLYYRNANGKQPALKVVTIENGCLGMYNDEDAHCNGKAAPGYTTTVTCYDARGKVVFKGSFTDADKTDETQFINANYKP